MLAFSRRRHEFGVATTLLTGVMLSFVSSSLLMLIMALVRAEQLQGIIFWMMGSVGLSDPGLLRWSAPVFLAGVLWAWWLAFPLNGLALGESAAHHLGLRVDRVQRSVFLAASLLTGLSVAISGIIGFVGLLVPHLLRPLLGSDHRWLIPASFMAGAAFLVGADLLSRTIISPLELPVGVITGLLGGSIFISSLYRRERHP
ncbi:MAG: Hemin transport system permease protein HmuU [candidate division TA06 bacterium ADurb.Bin417]|uniref:Hemin transport system permease protein HmuU n=1 Tax=candidate division TA06 bacterium ADurb.Bin417 TaxID=1852828 RepID=A0A1V5MAG9_UNCT6|nr:MAG: Hemin transport system permease protein HmuU [candidate division TA06 bacterium ADurb.Bin417]